MKSFESVEQDRNIEQDRKTFIEAVSATSIEEIPTIFDESAVKSLLENLSSNRLFILGETHGVKENTNIIYTLFKKFEFRQLALEWEPELKQIAERYIETGELDFDVIHDSPDGRVTAGHFALLTKLASEGILEKLICFDESSGRDGWDERDALMAQNILANVTHASTLVVAGNLHTKTEAITFDENFDINISEHHPMGEHLKKAIPTLSSGKIECLSGNYHNYGIQTFQQSPEIETASMARFYQDQGGLYIFEIPKVQAAVVPNPHETIPD